MSSRIFTGVIIIALMPSHCSVVNKNTHTKLLAWFTAHIKHPANSNHHYDPFTIIDCRSSQWSCFMIKAFITKQELLKGKESLLSWTDFLTKRNNLSTEALIYPCLWPTYYTKVGTRWEALLCSDLSRPVLIKAVQKADTFSRNAISLQNTLHRIVMWEPVRGWYQISKSKHVPLAEHNL